MKLTDEQLQVLLQCAVWIIKNAPRKDTRGELMQLDLLRYDQIDELGYYNPTSMAVWRLTDLGHEVLEDQIVQALSTAQMYHTKGSLSIVRMYLTKVPIEDLPSLFTHRYPYIRKYAKERMEELIDGTS